MFIAIAISTSKAKRHDKAVAGEKVGKSPRSGRVSRDVFLKMGRKKQQSYLEQFPRSSHRRLIKQNVKPKKTKREVEEVPEEEQEEVKKPGRPKMERHFDKRISREEFDELDAKRQKIYEKEHGAKFTRKHFTEKKPNATKKQNEGGVKVYDGNNDAELKEDAKYEKKGLALARLNMKQELKHGITANSIRAIENLTQKDLEVAHKQLSKNREENVDTIMGLLDQQTAFTPVKPDDFNKFHDNLKESVRHPELLTESEKDTAKSLSKKLSKGLNQLSLDEYSVYDKVRNNRNDDEIEDAEYEEVTDEEPESDEEDKGFIQKGAQAADSWNKRRFWRRDLEAFKKAWRGEKIDPTGRSNLNVLGSITAKYALMLVGGGVLTIGAAPAAVGLMGSLKDSWEEADEDVYKPSEKKKGGSWGAFGRSEEEQELDDREALGILYDQLVEQLQYIDLDELKDNTRNSFGKAFESKASMDTSGRVSYRCLPEERALPMEQKTHWNIYYNGDSIGKIFVDPEAVNPKPTLRSWRAVVYEDGFNPIDFPHVDDEDEETMNSIEEPYVLVDYDEKVENDLELHNPVLMSLHEARQWVRSIING